MTLLDTNVVIDLLGDGTGRDANWSYRTYCHAIASGDVAYNHIILAELSGQADRLEDLLGKLDALQMDIVDFSVEAAFASGMAFREYRRRGGERQSILADFLVAGHAQALGATLVTRDRRLASYFPDLIVITPETHP